MRGLAYAIAAVAAVGIMFVIATSNNEQSSDPTAAPATAETQTADTQAVAESAEVLASTTDAEGGLVTLAVPEMHCEFACFPKVKETLESDETVELVELGPQKEEGAIDNRQVIVTYKAGFDVKNAIALLSKEGFDDSDVVK